MCTYQLTQIQLYAHTHTHINEIAYTLTPSNRNFDLKMQLCLFVLEIFAQLLIKHTSSNDNNRPTTYMYLRSREKPKEEGYSKD